LRRIVRGRSAVDLDWLWAALAERDPLDLAAIAASPIEFIVVATSARSGEPLYLRPGSDCMFDALKGSCALPGLYRERVSVDGEPLIDGGVSDPIPVAEAYRRGARRILVVRSRPAGYVKTAGWSSRLSSLFLRGQPVVAKAMRRTAERYQRAVALLRAPPGDCRVIHVAPVAPMSTGRTTQDRRALERDYAHGREMAEDAIARWRAITMAAGGR
jgi:predicted patatin/cPLA2 family phospholipase